MGIRALFDSNVVILFSKRKIDVGELSSRYEELYVSIVTYIEVYAYDFEEIEEKELVDSFFEGVEIIEANKEVAELGIVYRKQKTKKIKLPDAVILATAKYLEADLIADNFGDFQNIDASVNVLSLDEFRVTH